MMVSALRPFVYGSGDSTPYVYFGQHVQAGRAKVRYAAPTRTGVVHLIHPEIATMIERGRVLYGVRFRCNGGSVDAALISTITPDLARCTRCVDIEAGPGVYRAFDASGALLYVGSSVEPEGRRVDHERSMPWWPQVARFEVERFEDITAAGAAEVLAIRDERPIYNRQHNQQAPAA